LAANNHAGLFSTQMEKLGYWQGFKQAVADFNGVDVSDIPASQYWDALSADWIDDSMTGGYLTEDMKKEILQAYAKADSAYNTSVWRDDADPDRSIYMKELQSNKVEKTEALGKEKDRYRIIAAIVGITTGKVRKGLSNGRMKIGWLKEHGTD